MAKEKGKRSIKTVDGYKVNHPHSFANMFYALLALLIVALPVGVLYVPLVISTGLTEFTITGMDLFVFIKNLFKNAPDCFLLLQGLGGGESILYQATSYLTFAQAILLILFAFDAVIAFFYFVIIVCKGYVRSAKFLKFIAGLNAFFAILFGCSFVTYYIIVRIEKITTSELFVWYSLIPTGAAVLTSMIMGSVYSSSFRNCIQESDIEYEEDVKNENQNLNIAEESSYDAATLSTLPPFIKEVSNGAFSRNQNLILADIPSGVPSLGNSSFANCLKLQVVNIPKSVKTIGFNCFFNCVSLQRINYEGTIEEWNAISRGSNWLAKAGTNVIHCLNGNITVNQLH